MNVLVTSAGVATAANVISALRKSQKYDCRIVATDQSEHASGLYLADAHYVTPGCRSEGFFDAISEIIKNEKIEFIFPLHSDEILSFSINKDRFADLGVGLIIADSSVVETCVDKERFLYFLSAHGLPFPETYSAESVPSFPVFIKPKVGSSSTGACRIDHQSELDFYLTEGLDDYLIQEFIDWQEVTVDCFVSKVGELIGCVPRSRIKIKDGKSMVAETLANHAIQAVCHTLLSALGYKGACNIQLFVRGDEIKVIEVNPRLAAGGLPLAVASGVNIPELMIDDYLGVLDSGLLPYRSGLKMYRYLTEVFV